MSGYLKVVYSENNRPYTDYTRQLCGEDIYKIIFGFQNAMAKQFRQHRVV